MDMRSSLKTLPGVRVTVERFRSAAEEAGFDKQVFQTDVELKLRMAGISVLEADDLEQPWLYLNVNVLHRETGQRAAFNIDLELMQAVILRSQLSTNLEDSTERTLGRATVYTPTWTSGVLGAGTVADARNAAKDLVDKFVNDWLTVNPLNGTA